jgi:uracil-DNA glycosylase
MVRASKTAEPYVPEDARSIERLREAAQGCRGCDLYANATQAVFGEGEKGALLMLVGEQPGDQEDQQGHPFVGPAGRELTRALEDAGIDPARIYVTNAVKHFKFEPRGKRRLHQKPNAGEVKACRPWLEREIEIVKPAIMVLLGATAAKAILGHAFTLTAHRGEIVEVTGKPPCVATWHPSAILRQRESEDRDRLRAELTRDLSHAAERAQALSA